MYLQPCLFPCHHALQEDKRRPTRKARAPAGGKQVKNTRKKKSNGKGKGKAARGKAATTKGAVSMEKEGGDEGGVEDGVADSDATLSEVEISSRDSSDEELGGSDREEMIAVQPRARGDGKRASRAPERLGG
jgi:hypothetical protein